MPSVKLVQIKYTFDKLHKACYNQKVEKYTYINFKEVEDSTTI